MKKQVRVFLALTAVLAALGLVFTGCDLGGDGGETNKITGVVRDSVSGDLVAAVTVSFGSSTDTTGGDGAFSFDLGASSGTLIRSWSTSASGYHFEYWEEVAVDASQDVDLQVYIGPIDNSGYPTRQIDLTVKDSGGAEIPTGWAVSLGVLNKNGGRDDWVADDLTYINGGPNTLDTHTFGSDCLVVAAVEDNTGAPQFVAWARQVDLSAATTPLTLTATAGTAVDITADAIGNMGALTLWTPYGPVDAGEWMFASSTLITGTIYNPYGYDGSWAQMRLDTSDTNYDKLLVSTSSISSIGTSVTLPALNDTLGPNAGYAGFSVSYSASTGVLSFPAVSGASSYFVYMEETSGPWLGQIFSLSESITLPQWLRTRLVGVTANVNVTATAGGIGTAYLSQMVGPGSPYPPDSRMAFALVKGGTEPGEGYVETGVAF